MILARAAGATGRIWAARRGLHGARPAQFPTGGDFPSPLANDVDAGDETSQFLWFLKPTLIDGASGGVTATTPEGGYDHSGAANGTYIQNYGFAKVKADGTAVEESSTITVTVGVGTASFTLTGSYAVRAAGVFSLSSAYAVRSAAALTLPGSYAVRSGAAFTLPASYEVEMPAGTASFVLPSSYAVRAGLARTLPSSYAVRTATSMTLPGAYAVREGVSASLPGSYAVRAALTVTLAGSYAVDGATGGGGSLDDLVEGDLTQGDVLRVLLAAIVGRTVGANTGTEIFLSQDGSKPRLTITYDSQNNRTTVVLDGTL